MSIATSVLVCLASFLLGVLIAMRFFRWAREQERLNYELDKLFFLDAVLPTWESQTDSTPREGHRFPARPPDRLSRSE